MKVVLALHDPAVSPALLEDPFRRAVAATGAATLQVNIDDEAVASAMRFGPGTPITAVLSLWFPRDGDGDPTAAVDVVRRLDPTVDAWTVEERTPLVPPETPDGVRTDALANIALLRRPEAMSEAEWARVWLEEHTAVAIATQHTFGYVQNRVLEALTPHPPAVAGIVEELFTMAAMSDPHAFYGSGGDDDELRRRFATLMASCARFGADQGLDLVPTSRYRFTL